MLPGRSSSDEEGGGRPLRDQFLGSRQTTYPWAGSRSNVWPNRKLIPNAASPPGPEGRDQHTPPHSRGWGHGGGGGGGSCGYLSGDQGLLLQRYPLTRQVVLRARNPARRLPLIMKIPLRMRGSAEYESFFLLSAIKHMFCGPFLLVFWQGDGLFPMLTPSIL